MWRSVRRWAADFALWITVWTLIVLSLECIEVVNYHRYAFAVEASPFLLFGVTFTVFGWRWRYQREDKWEPW